MVLSCLCESELILGVDRYTEEYRRRGLDWHVVPIPDMTAPSPDQDILLDRAFSVAAPVLAAGGALAIHCLAGLGRTGMIAARFAMSYGLSAAQAIAFIRARHDSQAIETRTQETYLLARDAGRCSASHAT
jgi:protein-tyrosine phosphatase